MKVAQTLKVLKLKTILKVMKMTVRKMIKAAVVIMGIVKTLRKTIVRTVKVLNLNKLLKVGKMKLRSIIRTGMRER